MSTKPLEAILYRELATAEARDVIDIASPLLQELVNYSTNALARCATSTSGSVDEDLAILALYRHLIEVTDGIEVLISQSCPIPAIPLLRSSFEASLSIEYILENEQDYVRRSLSWLVGYIHQRLDMYERLDPSTGKGTDFKGVFDDDKTAANVSLPELVEVQKAITNLQAMLTKPHIRPIEAEFSSSTRRSPHWYQLFVGPSNLRELSQYLDRGGQYEILYRYWSRSAHAQDLLPFISRTDKGESAIGRLRNPNQISEITSYAATFILGATRLVLGKLRSGEDLSEWYKREVRERYLSIVGSDRLSTTS